MSADQQAQGGNDALNPTLDAVWAGVLQREFIDQWQYQKRRLSEKLRNSFPLVMTAMTTGDFDQVADLAMVELGMEPIVQMRADTVVSAQREASHPGRSQGSAKPDQTRHG